MSKTTIPQELRLTPTLKAVIEGGIKLIKKGHIQGKFMFDPETNTTYNEGWHENGKKPLVCAVGGLQRAAWIQLGKPDMSDYTNQKKVENLVLKAQQRIELFLPEDVFMYEADYKAAVAMYEDEVALYKDDPEFWGEPPRLEDYLDSGQRFDDLVEFNDAKEFVGTNGKPMPLPQKRILAAFEAAIGLVQGKKK